MLLTLDISSGCFPDTASLPLCNPWSGAEDTLPFSVMLLRCHSVSSPFICWALDHFLVSQHLPQRLGSREETKAIFRQINCIVCRTQQVCCLHWQHCRLFVLFFNFFYSPPHKPHSQIPPFFVWTVSTDAQAVFWDTTGAFFIKKDWGSSIGTSLEINWYRVYSVSN